MSEKKILLERVIGEIEGLKFRIKDLQEILEKLSSLEGVCPICESKLSEERKNILITQKQGQLKSLDERLNEVSEKRQINEQELRNLEEALKKLGEMLAEIKV